jgi:hypothetical protein
MAVGAPVVGGTRLYSHWPFNFEPVPSDFGAQFQTLSRALGTNGATITGTATTSVYLGIPASRTFSVPAASMQGYLGFTGASAITAQLIKIDNTSTTTGTAVTLTAAQDITTTVFTGSDNNVDFPITVGGKSRTLFPGDTLLWKIVAVGNVTAGVLQASVEIAIRK